jgi:hypothetical protein
MAPVLLAILLIAEFVGAATLLMAQHRQAPDTTIPRSVRLVDMGGPATAPLLDRVGAGMDRAIAVVEEFWGTDWPPEIVVVATGSPAQFAAEAGLDPARRWDDIAAVAVADSVDLAARRASGQRIVLAPGAARMSEAALQLVLTHELFHLAARPDTALDAPRWLTEGVADFVARPAVPLPPLGAADVSLPDDTSLDSSGPARSAGYDRAWWFARFVADEFGTGGLLRLYRDACGPGHPDFPAAVSRALGVDTTELRARWARWLSRPG